MDDFLGDVFEEGKLFAELFRLRDELAECHRQIDEGIASQYRIEQILGVILYGKNEEGLPLWGEHTAETLAVEAVRKLAKMQTKIGKLEELLQEWLNTPFFATENEWKKWVEPFRSRVRANLVTLGRSEMEPSEWFRAWMKQMKDDQLFKCE